MSYQIFNWIACLSLFSAYILLLKKVLFPHNFIYLLLNLIGGISFVIVGVFAKVWSVWIFNGMWVIITLGAIIKLYFCKNIKK